jgi:hypothetical protein
LYNRGGFLLPRLGDLFQPRTSLGFSSPFLPPLSTPLTEPPASESCGPRMENVPIGVRRLPLSRGKGSSD